MGTCQPSDFWLTFRKVCSNNHELFKVSLESIHLADFWTDFGVKFLTHSDRWDILSYSPMCDICQTKGFFLLPVLKYTAAGFKERLPNVGLLSGLMKVCNVLNLNGSTASYHPPPLSPRTGLCSVSALLTRCTRNRCTTTCSLKLCLPLLCPLILLFSPIDHCMGWGWPREKRLPRGLTHACPHPCNLWPPVCFPVSPSEHRCVESAKIRNKYPDRVPVSEGKGGWGVDFGS